ncbi:hypothetical protein F5Y03DRAFT_391542 [Xylaria venustula]|nr:hypothetical protein F5Y03DRAFT_391542 [Xylaria venustula]
MALIITSLPCEIIAAVFTKLDHIKFLLPCLLTCRHFYHAYKEYPRSGIEILEQQIGRALLPYAVAVQEASGSPGPHPRLSTTELLETLHNDAGSLTNRLRDYPLMAMVRLEDTHSRVKKHAKSCASKAWRGIWAEECQNFRRRIPIEPELPFSSTERFRFRRTFYRFELYVRIFREDNDQHMDLFLSSSSPWENEQLACASDYLREILNEIFGPFRGRDPADGLILSRPFWVAQGLEFIGRLENATSDEDRSAVGRSAPAVRQLRLPTFASPTSNGYLESRYVLQYQGGDPGMAMEKDKEDSNLGPYIAWHQNIDKDPTPRWIDKNWCNRRFAYVFWDSSRIETYDLLDLFSRLFK